MHGLVIRVATLNLQKVAHKFLLQVEFALLVGRKHPEKERSSKSVTSVRFAQEFYWSVLEKGQANKCLEHRKRLAKQFNIVVRSAVDLLCNLHLESYLKSHEQSHPQTNLLVLCQTLFEYKNKSSVCDGISKPIICYIIYLK